MARFEGKVAVVTGAARGIGQAIAVQFAKDGANVALCDLKAEWLEETASLVKNEGREVITCAVDVGDFAAVEACVSDIITKLGRVDFMVNNAGITKDTLLVRMTEQDWDDVLRVNLKGTFNFTKAVAKPMMKQRSGSIVNIASIVGQTGQAGQCNYSASKAGVIALTKSTARELASRGVRANAIAPGFVRSKMTDALSEDVKEKMLSVIPMGRYGEPTDIAKVVAFLASDDSSYMTGQVLGVNGGMGMM